MKNLLILFLLFTCTGMFAQTNEIGTLRKQVEKNTNLANKKIQEFILNFSNIPLEKRIEIFNAVIIDNGVVKDISNNNLIFNLPKDVQKQFFKVFLNNENFIIQNADGSIYMRGIESNDPKSNWAYPFTSGYIRDHVQKGAKSCKRDCEDSPGYWCWWVNPCDY